MFSVKPPQCPHIELPVPPAKVHNLLEIPAVHMCLLLGMVYLLSGMYKRVHPRGPFWSGTGAPNLNETDTPPPEILFKIGGSK